MYQRILVPLDGSRQAEAVLPFASMVAKMNEAQVVLLRVVEYPYEIYSLCYEYPPSDPTLAKTIEHRKKAIYIEAKNYLEGIAIMLAKSGIKVTVEVRESPVVSAILASSNSFRADLIVLSARGQGGGAERAIGAIPDRVLHEASVEVILIQSTASTRHFFKKALSFQHRMPVLQ